LQHGGRDHGVETARGVRQLLDGRQRGLVDGFGVDGDEAFAAPGGYDFGRPGYNPGGLGGPASGIGVRPGLGAGGFGPGR